MPSSPSHDVSFLSLPSLWIGLLFTWTWRKNRNIYHRYGCDTVSIIPFISGSPTIYTRSMQVGKQIIVSGHRSGAFGKADHLTRFFLFWGSNIISAEGELWRKHRRITSPAFYNETYAFV
ncbi:hypothetical protein OG21DRAFT_1296764 [Imleria badia]|nr:hypothetical protein OG21DRAFT_1296764 [Imleria badia]